MYHVIFERLDEAISEQEKAIIQSKLAEKFKLSEDKAKKIITTAPLVVKKVSTLEEARKYKSALESIGARARIVLLKTEADSQQPDSHTSENFPRQTSEIPAKLEVTQESLGEELLTEDESAKPGPTPSSLQTPADLQEDPWWKDAWIVNIPYEKSARPLSPITIGKISKRRREIITSHPVFSRIDYNDLQLISVFQLTNGKIFLDLFLRDTMRPARIEASLINFPSFEISTGNLKSDVAELVKQLLKGNKSAFVDLPTYRFLKDDELIKIVYKESDVEQYLGSLKEKLASGLEPGKSQYLVRWCDGLELLKQEDPWLPAQPQVPPPPLTTQTPPSIASATNVPPATSPLTSAQTHEATHFPPVGFTHFPPTSQPLQTANTYSYPGEPNPPIYQIQLSTARAQMELSIERAQRDAKTALLLAAASLLCSCLVPLSVVSLVKAHDATKTLEACKIEEGKGLALAAKILSIIAIAHTLFSFLASILK
ncbi:MAG: hypothetical protein RMM17_06260 [Acidobacteriota bacterium]|nr:hypothetical protein [Blastocatellia bacterium]MDW8412271.1 hypothetical protein [Acidobacteriota bacterium]